MLNDQYIKQLKNDGYIIIENAINEKLTVEIANEMTDWFDKTPASKGDFYGQGTTTRFGSLLSKCPATQKIVTHPDVMKVNDEFLRPTGYEPSYCDWYQLSLSQAVQIHPGAPMQPVHMDELMYPCSKENEYMINVIWAIDDFTETNGATRVWPAPMGPKGMFDYNLDDSIVAEMPKGSALIFLGSTRHCGGANVSLAGRTAIIFSYSLGWLKQNENQFLVYPPDVAKSFSKEIQDLIGYRIHRPNLGGYEYNTPAVLLNDELPDTLAATDELPPHIQEIIDEMKREDKWAS